MRNVRRRIRLKSQKQIRSARKRMGCLESQCPSPKSFAMTGELGILEPMEEEDDEVFIDDSDLDDGVQRSDVEAREVKVFVVRTN